MKLSTLPPYLLRRELKRVHKRYEQIFERMVKAQYLSPEHLGLVDEERRLNRREITIRKLLQEIV